MITDLAHTAFAVHDMETSLEFFARLGLVESFRLHREDGSLMLIYLHVAGDRFVELFPGGPTPANDRIQSFRHLCLMVDNLETMVADLRSAGIVIEREVTQGLDSNLQAWIRDPDGNPIELMQISDDSPQRAQERTWSAARDRLIQP